MILSAICILGLIEVIIGIIIREQVDNCKTLPK